MEGMVILLVVLGLMAMGVPLFVIIGGATAACFGLYPSQGDPYATFQDFSNNYGFIEPMAKLAEQDGIVAIPFFMIAGAIMSKGEIAKRIVDFANALIGWFPGGLALTTIGACMFFAAISGSSPVTVVTIGAIMLPALAAAGYDEKMGLGLVTSAGSLGIIIPPSIPMIIYAIFATAAQPLPVDVGDMFMAGIGPGLLIGALLAIYCVWKGRGVERQPFEVKAVGTTLADGIWALLFPVFILGGIYGGLFNATEASAISVILALGIELYIHRSLKMQDLPKILGETSVLMGSILVIVCVAFAFADFMAFAGVPDAIVEWLRSLDISSWTFVLILNIMLLMVGCLMDIISAIILFVPLILPIATQLGFDPIHVGLIFIVNLEIGYLTPPLGLNLFVSSTYFNKDFGLVIRSVLPYLGLLVVALLVVTYVPTCSTGLLNLRNPDRERVVQVEDAERPSGEAGESESSGIWQSFPDAELEKPVTRLVRLALERVAEREEEKGLLDEGKAEKEKVEAAKEMSEEDLEALDDGGDSLEEMMRSDEFKTRMLKSASDDEDDEGDEDDDDLELPPLEDEDASAAGAADATTVTDSGTAADPSVAEPERDVGPVETGPTERDSSSAEP